MNLDFYHNQLLLPSADDLKREFLAKERDRIEHDALEEAKSAEKKAVESAYSNAGRASWFQPSINGNVASQVGNMAFRERFDAVFEEKSTKLERDFALIASELNTHAETLSDSSGNHRSEISARAGYCLSVDRMSGGALKFDDAQKQRLQEIQKWDGEDKVQAVKNGIDLLKIERSSIQNRASEIEMRARQAHEDHEKGPNGISDRYRALEEFRNESAEHMKTLQEVVQKTDGVLGRLSGKHREAKAELAAFQKERDDNLAKLEKDAKPRDFDPSDIRSKIDRALKSKEREVNKLEDLLTKYQEKVGRSEKKEQPSQKGDAPAKDQASQASEQGAPGPKTASDRVKAEAVRVAELSKHQAEKAAAAKQGRSDKVDPSEIPAQKQQARPEERPREAQPAQKPKENKMTDIDAEKERIKKIRDLASKRLAEKVASENPSSKAASSKGRAPEDQENKTSRPPFQPEAKAPSVKEGPPKIQGFVRDQGGVYKKPEEQKPAFVDKGANVSMEKRPPDVKEIRAAAALCQEKGMRNVKLSGTPEFKQAAWIEGTARGMNMRGYKPTDEDIEKARERQEQLQNSQNVRALNEQRPHAEAQHYEHIR